MLWRRRDARSRSIRGIARRDTFTPPRSFGWATRTKAARKCRCSNGCRLRTAKHARARSSWDVCGARHRCHARRATTATPSSLLRRALVLEPRAPASHLDLGVALLEGGQAAEAIERLNTAAALNAPLDVHRQLAKAYAALGRTDESAKEQATYERLRRESISKTGRVR